MADLQPIKPEDLNYLNRHTLTQQELSGLDEGQQALAKDWNIINRKLEWMIHEQVFLHNTLVEHDRLLDLWKKIIWLFGMLFAVAGSVATFWKVLT